MGDAVRSVLSKYATFSGRAGRGEFWWWVLAVLIASFVVGVIDNMLFPTAFDHGMGGGGPLSILLGLAVLLPNLAVSVRRLHDLDRTGWWLLIGLVPLIGFLVLLFFYVQRGTPGPNRFGVSTT
jgi:uncharacterized membrane protein YhaH (DUF805 family)